MEDRLPTRYRIVGHIPRTTTCEIINPHGSSNRTLVHVRFEDGSTLIIDRRKLRQAKQSTQGETNVNV